MKLQFEIWKNHRTYVNYCGSSLGHVKNIKTDKLLFGYKDLYGYIRRKHCCKFKWKFLDDNIYNYMIKI